jgi:hypothetical protein
VKLGKSLELSANQNRVGRTFSNGKKRETKGQPVWAFPCSIDNLTSPVSSILATQQMRMKENYLAG